MAAADVLVESLMAWGVDTVFGLPGDGINGIMEALRVRQDRVRFINFTAPRDAAIDRCDQSGDVAVKFRFEARLSL